MRTWLWNPFLGGWKSVTLVDLRKREGIDLKRVMQLGKIIFNEDNLMRSNKSTVLLAKEGKQSTLLQTALKVFMPITKLRPDSFQCVTDEDEAYRIVGRMVGWTGADFKPVPPLSPTV
jgi:hypothetical protein